MGGCFGVRDRRFCSLSCARSQTPCRDPPFPRRLAGEPRTAAFHPSPNTPSKASLPPKKQEEVSPMCPVRCVTYVSGRSSPVNTRLLSLFHFQGIPLKKPICQLF